MGCLLRASGKNFSVNNFIKVTGLKPCNVFVKGTPKFESNPKGKKCSESGVNVVVSDTDFDNFNKQINDSINFLKKYKKVLQSYRKLDKDIGNMVLDFGISRKDVAVQTNEFPPELLILAGGLGISIQFSQYPEMEGDSSLNGDRIIEA